MLFSDTALYSVFGRRRRLRATCCRHLASTEVSYTVCPTCYRNRHFFNSNANEDNATKFEQEYFRCVSEKLKGMCL